MFSRHVLRCWRRMQSVLALQSRTNFSKAIIFRLCIRMEVLSRDVILRWKLRVLLLARQLISTSIQHVSKRTVDMRTRMSKLKYFLCKSWWSWRIGITIPSQLYLTIIMRAAILIWTKPTEISGYYRKKGHWLPPGKSKLEWWHGESTKLDNEKKSSLEKIMSTHTGIFDLLNSCDLHDDNTLFPLPYLSALWQYTSLTKTN